MLVKTVILFLGVMAIIGFIGSKLFPGSITRRMKNSLTPGKLGGKPESKSGGKHPRCPSCGRYLIGKGGCDCRKKG
ncbi:MAG: hypothetical protein CFE34_05205 [Rhodobacteraceae bacterium PARR1]|nr:MAG: hypothetical protein CFE34_05205 [Rhodobacteraceae bacterium PARR1]